MLRRYELTDDEWNRIVDLLPPENTGKQGRPRKITVLSLMESSGLHAVVRPGVTYQNAMVPGKPFTAAFENGLTTEFSIISSDF